jgi:Arm DNA-binding domain
MALTDINLRNAKPTKSIVKLSDGGGLQCWIMPLPAGSKLWRIAYRYEGKQKLLAIGAYPAMTLTAARDKRDWAKDLLASGIDPSIQERLDKLEKTDAKANTFALIASELLAKKRREGKASNTIGKREWLYSLTGDPLASVLSLKSQIPKFWLPCAR